MTTIFIIACDGKIASFKMGVLFFIFGRVPDSRPLHVQRINYEQLIIISIYTFLDH